MSSGSSFNPLGILGALGGAAASGDSTQTKNAAPWGPAQPYILSNINSASRLQNAYQQNPLSPLQQRAYANAFNASDNARQGLSSLSSQLNNNTGWSRNSGSRLPTAYNFTPLSSGGGSGGLFGGALPSGGGQGIIDAMAGSHGNSATSAGSSATGGGQNSGGQSWDGQPGSNGLGYTPTTDLSNPSYTSFLGNLVNGLDGYGNALGGWLPGGFLARALAGGLLNTATVSEATANRDALAKLVAADPSFGGGGYSGGGLTTAPTGAGIATNPMAPDPATVQQAIAAAAASPEVRMVWDHDSKSFVPASGGSGGSSIGSAGGSWTGGGGYVTGTGGYGKPGEAGGGFATGGGWGV